MLSPIAGANQSAAYIFRPSQSPFLFGCSNTHIMEMCNFFYVYVSVLTHIMEMCNFSCVYVSVLHHGNVQLSLCVNFCVNTSIMEMCNFSQVQQGIFLPESASCVDSLTVSVQPLCAIALTNICEYVKKTHQTLAAIPLFGHREILGSVVLVVAVSYAGKATRISRKGQ